MIPKNIVISKKNIDFIYIFLLYYYYYNSVMEQGVVHCNPLHYCNGIVIAFFPHKIYAFFHFYTISMKYITGLDNCIEMRYNIMAMSIMKEDIKNKQFLIDLYVYGNLSFSEIMEIGKRFFSLEEVEEVLDYLNNLEKSYQEWLRENKRFEDKNEIQVMVEFFPDLIEHPEEILESLKENLKSFIKTKDELDFLMIKNSKLLTEEKEKQSPVYLEIKGRYLKCIERINALSSLIEFLETYKKVPEKTDFTEERENFRYKVKKVLSLDIDRVIENEFGIKILGGEPVMIRCQLPGHNDKNPSFAVYRKTNSFYCFGCQRGGNIINFIKYLFNFDFIEAVNYLYKKYV